MSGNASRGDSSSKRLLLIGGIAATVLAVPLAVPGIFSSQFLPHAFCYTGDAGLISAHLISDALIWLSYVVIAGTLVYLVRQLKNEMPFQWMFLAFGLFIIACGFTHFMEIVTLWKPVYWVSAYVKIITAVASALTAVALPPLVPRIRELAKSAARSREIQDELAASNRELEAFSYSVSHDLRAPLRAIDGFSQAVLEDSAGKLDEQSKADLQRARAAAKRMGALIDDLLKLSQTARSDMSRERVDLSRMAQEIATQLKATGPERNTCFTIAPGLVVVGDRGLLQVALENLLSNAWKFTGKTVHATIELGMEQQNGHKTFFVRDNGAGFDMQYASKLFGAFQRMHDSNSFPGTGVGLATVQRIIRRHGGRIWAKAAIDQGATFYFELNRQ
ncbi:MAG TPA: ATP-binding protein [Candidatus Angelobacter sp.]|jgi:signal transduction histidine kinase|nr:ATP-binding protein [Candidatus Angelobacter sp.]